MERHGVASRARAGCEQVVGLKRDFDQRLQTCRWRGQGRTPHVLRSAPGGGMRFPAKSLETMPEQGPLAEVQCGLDVGKPHRF